MLTRVLLAVTCTAAAGVALGAMQPVLDADAIQDALAIGQSRLEVERARFQQPYRVVVGTAPIDYVEVVTPFRRVELAAEARLAAGDRTFGQREAREMLAAAADQLDVDIELTFHPLNTYIGVPNYGVVLVAAGESQRVPPLDVERIPRYGPRVDGLPSVLPQPAAAVLRRREAQPLTGGTVIGHFDARALDANGSYVVVMVEGEQEVGRATVDLARMR